MAKLNLEFYKEDINYDLSITKQEENDIIEYINKYSEDEFETIFETDIRVPVFVNLSDIRNNIINWYPFKENGDVLEIGAGFGSITGELCKKCKTVTSIEFIKKRVEAICKRHKNKENLEVICGKLEDINFEKKYDYITLIGVTEYADILFGGLNKLIKYIKNLLNENGVILIAIDNKFGVKYLAGETNTVVSIPYANMTGVYSNGYKTYGKYEFENILKLNNINNYKFYYPLPDYKLTNVIYSDNYLPDENDSKIIYNRYYNENSKVLFNELNIYKEIIKNNEFKFFANSFFVELLNFDNKLDKPNFISYNNMRKIEYKLCTKIYNEYVIKSPIKVESMLHINKISSNIEKLNSLGFDVIDKLENNSITSKFIKHDTFDKILSKMFLSNKKDEGLNKIDIWYKYLKDNLKIEELEDNCFTKNNINLEMNLKKKMNFTKNGFIDLVFENTFFIENKFVFYDQEWYFENIPIEFILYRAINNLYSYNPEIEKIITKENLYIRYDIKDLLEIFGELEYKIQMDIIDKNKYHFYGLQHENIENIQKIINLNEEILKEKNNLISEVDTMKNENVSLLNELKEMQERILTLENKIDKIFSSNSWKITKPLRKVSEILKKDVY